MMASLAHIPQGGVVVGLGNLPVPGGVVHQ
jgi:hypothetical protein